MKELDYRIISSISRFVIYLSTKVLLEFSSVPSCLKGREIPYISVKGLLLALIFGMDKWCKRPDVEKEKRFHSDIIDFPPIGFVRDCVCGGKQ